MRIERIFISPGHNFYGHQDQPPGEHPTVEVNEAECVAGKGLFGDRFFGYKENFKGQVTFFSAEVFDDVCQKLGVSGLSSEEKEQYLQALGARGGTRDAG